VSGDERLRLFLALRVPEEALHEIERWQNDQLPNVRLVPRANLHVTLAFLGHRPSDERHAILDALRTSAARAGEIRLTPLRYRETRSAGMLVLEDERGNAAALAGDVQQRLEHLGVYRREARPWLPHLTVARWRERPHLRPEAPPHRTFVPSDAAAYLSRLHPEGARYEVLESVALGG
jgi:2'-5' RNA ligase